MGESPFLRQHQQACRGNKIPANAVETRPQMLHAPAMKLTAVYEPAAEGGYTCWVEEIPAAISEGDSLEEAEANLQEALALVLECQRELSDLNRSPASLKKSLELSLP